ncbi:PAS domain S-box protein [Leptospira inadai serovar Lyme str. 10]|uniref:histidine kinase n=2 Tax=Leptospira inadai serovar Lyme TaxID=293084 RepID=V6HLA2_9LEPT|nr:PAS domain S-box protein [Leptospira inadai]EQA37680.1 PAS domain S-box protein [Leptospira inadai serovar Lyme str. 10]PNV75653.1 PAS domain-containing sensor histidine kinase [Leptospira inadai serovar Lyme]
MGTPNESIPSSIDFVLSEGQVYKDRLEYILSNVTLVLFSTDRNGTFTYAAGCGIFGIGIEPESLVGASFFEVDWSGRVRDSNGEFRPMTREAIFQSVFQGRMIEAETRFGGKIFSSRFSPVFGTEGEIEGLIGVSIDITDSKRREASFLRKVGDFSTALQVLPIIVFSFDLDGVILFAEGKGFERLGLTVQDVIGRNFFDSQPDQVERNQAIQKAIGGVDSFYQSRVRGKVFENWLYPRFDELGRTTEILGIGYDVTEREVLNNKLRESELNYRNLFKSNPQIMYIFDRESFRILESNSTAQSVCGYSESEFLEKTVLDIHPADDRSWVLDKVQNLALGPNFFSEVLHRKKSGEFFYLDIALTHFRFSGRDCILVSGSDVTQRVRTEAENRFNLQLLSQISDAVIALDSEFRITYYNLPAQHMYEISDPSLIGKHYRELFQEDWISDGNRTRAMDEYERNGIANAEIIHTLKSGKRIHLETSFKKISDPRGNDAGLIMVNRDIAEKVFVREFLKKAVSDLEMTNRELEQFAYVASHDLQEPLRTIASYLQLLERKFSPQLPSEAKEFIQITIEAAKRQQGLIESLLRYSRLGVKEDRWEKINVKALLENIREDLSSVLKEAKVRIEIEGEMPVVLGEPDQIRQLFQNLITNSVKFRSPERSPKIVISAAKTRAEWKFRIADNGIGIDSRYFDKIFIIFQKLHPKSEFPGTGIGLSVCKKIVENHGGKIWVESDVGVGSEFFFTIPVRRD